MKPYHPLAFFAMFCSLITLLLLISFGGLLIGFIRQDLMAFGLTFAGHPLTGLTKEEAQNEIVRHVQEELTSPALILSYGDRRWEASPTDIGLTADIPATVEQAFAVGRSGSLPRRIVDALSCALRQREIPLVLRQDAVQLKKWLDPVAASIHEPARDAACTLAPDGAIHRLPSVTGVTLDAAALANTLTPELTALRLPRRAVLTPAIKAPAIATDDLAAVDTVLGVYTTYYDPNSNRGKNIERAAIALDHVLIKKGAAFSFNAIVGNRVADAGYLTAPVIVDGKIEQDIGGGVCQVSSTLYNAILLADLTPTQRTAHFYPSSYVPAGLDATVADGQIDFCFANQLPHNVYLLTSAESGTLTICVLGAGSDVPADIRLETAVIGPNPTVESYRIYERNGEETGREFLHTDEYDIPPPDPQQAEQAPDPPASRPLPTVDTVPSEETDPAPRRQERRSSPGSAFARHASAEDAA